MISMLMLEENNTGSVMFLRVEKGEWGKKRDWNLVTNMVLVIQRFE